jgi:DHA1 family bicyclomycin/chloramphenicol resistance-like MFS transporter
MFGFGFVGPNSLALAMQRYPQAAGAASAVLGSFQFVMAAVIAPLAGVGGVADALPMALLILTMPVAALGSRILLAGSGAGEPPAAVREPVMVRVETVLGA